MLPVKNVLQDRGIQVTKEEERQVEGFYQSLQRLKLDYDDQAVSTKEILLTQNILKKE